MYSQSQGGHARAKLQRFHDGAGAAQGAAPSILMTGRYCNSMRRLARSRRFKCAHSVARVRTRLVLPPAGADRAALSLARCCDAHALADGCRCCGRRAAVGQVAFERCCGVCAEQTHRPRSLVQASCHSHARALVALLSDKVSRSCEFMRNHAAVTCA